MEKSSVLMPNDGRVGFACQGWNRDRCEDQLRMAHRVLISPQAVERTADSRPDLGSRTGRSCGRATRGDPVLDAGQPRNLDNHALAFRELQYTRKRVPIEFMVRHFTKVLHHEQEETASQTRGGFVLLVVRDRLPADSLKPLTSTARKSSRAAVRSRKSYPQPR